MRRLYLLPWAQALVYNASGCAWERGGRRSEMSGSRLFVHNLQGATIVGFGASTMLDSAVIEQVGQELYALVDEKATKRIVLDFDNVRFLASQAVSVLLTLKKKADAIGSELAICSMREELRRVFKIMNLEKLFRFYSGEKEALAAWDIYIA
jgi:anti-anti-sigma factor